MMPDDELSSAAPVNGKSQPVGDMNAGHPTKSPILLGDIYRVDWTPGRGSEQTGERPAVIVQNNAFNSNDRYPNTVVIAISKRGRDVPTHVRLLQSQENGLREPVSYVKCEQLLTISKERLGPRIGRLTADQRAQVTRALKRVLSIPIHTPELRSGERSCAHEPASHSQP